MNGGSGRKVLACHEEIVVLREAEQKRCGLPIPDPFMGLRIFPVLRVH
jgi:hypothetical protein